MQSKSKLASNFRSHLALVYVLREMSFFVISGLRRIHTQMYPPPHGACTLTPQSPPPQMLTFRGGEFRIALIYKTTMKFASCLKIEKR